MEIPERLRCVFSANLEEHENSYTIEVPSAEIKRKNIRQGEFYRVAVLSGLMQSNSEKKSTGKSREQHHDGPRPPVAEGETRTVEIEDIGDQGDGLTRVERGFVVIVPDTDPGERVTVEITDVRENVAFASVVERVSYYQ